MRISGSDEMASILVVDDDPDSRDVLTRSLLKAGYAVRSAENGRLALIAVASAMPDVIVLDVRMPEMNANRVARDTHPRTPSPHSRRRGSAPADPSPAREVC